MNRHPWARDRRKEKRGTRWDTLAERFPQPETAHETAQEAPGDAHARAGGDASTESQRTAREAR